MSEPEQTRTRTDDPCRARILATLLAAQADHVARRRRQRQAATLVAVALLAFGSALAIRGARLALIPDAPPPMIVDATEHGEPAPIEFGSTPVPDPTNASATRPATGRIARVGGDEPRWTRLPSTDPKIIERLAITASRIDARPIAIATTDVERDTPVVDDDALLDHLIASGRTEGLLRIDGRVMLMTHERLERNGG